MKNDKTIKELIDEFNDTGHSTINVVSAISTSWVAMNILGWTNQEMSENEMLRLNARIEKQKKIDRQLYLKEIQKYTGYRIILQDLDNK